MHTNKKRVWSPSVFRTPGTYFISFWTKKGRMCYKKVSFLGFATCTLAPFTLNNQKSRGTYFTRVPKKYLTRIYHVSMWMWELKYDLKWILFYTSYSGTATHQYSLWLSHKPSVKWPLCLLLSMIRPHECPQLWSLLSDSILLLFYFVAWCKLR